MQDKYNKKRYKNFWEEIFENKNNRSKVLSDDLQNKGVNVIDFWPLMNNDCYLIQDSHYNATGHDIVFKDLNSMLINNL